MNLTYKTFDFLDSWSLLRSKLKTRYSRAKGKMEMTTIEPGQCRLKLTTTYLESLARSIILSATFLIT